MVAYSFQRQFVPPIEDGSKAQTIRADRMRHARAGELLQLYQGMRTKHCRLIGVVHFLSCEPLLGPVVTHYDPPPIPTRDCDWSAIDDSTYDVDCDQDGFYSLSPIGWGRTEAETIADLLEKMEA